MLQDSPKARVSRIFVHFGDDFVQRNLSYYVIVKYSDKGDLGKYIKNRTRLIEDEAVLYLAQIINGFQALYKQDYT